MASLLKRLTSDELCVMSFINGPFSPTTLTIGGEFHESVLSHRAALAMLSLISRGLVKAESFNDTGRVTYSVTDAAKEIKGKVSQTFLAKHGKWSLTEPRPSPTEKARIQAVVK